MNVSVVGHPNKGPPANRSCGRRDQVNAPLLFNNLPRGTGRVQGAGGRWSARGTGEIYPPTTVCYCTKNERTRPRTASGFSSVASDPARWSYGKPIPMEAILFKLALARIHVHARRAARIARDRHLSGGHLKPADRTAVSADRSFPLFPRTAPLEIRLPFRLTGHAHLKLTRQHRLV
jgi:hypothetical protein